MPQASHTIHATFSDRLKAFVTSSTSAIASYSTHVKAFAADSE